MEMTVEALEDLVEGLRLAPAPVQLEALPLIKQCLQTLISETYTGKQAEAQYIAFGRILGLIH